jgi:hypothetical protein
VYVQGSEGICPRRVSGHNAAGLAEQFVKHKFAEPFEKHKYAEQFVQHKFAEQFVKHKFAEQFVQHTVHAAWRRMQIVSCFGLWSVTGFVST